MCSANEGFLGRTGVDALCERIHIVEADEGRDGRLGGCRAECNAQNGVVIQLARLLRRIARARSQRPAGSGPISLKNTSDMRALRKLSCHAHISSSLKPIS